MDASAANMVMNREPPRTAAKKKGSCKLRAGSALQRHSPDAVQAHQPAIVIVALLVAQLSARAGEGSRTHQQVHFRP